MNISLFETALCITAKNKNRILVDPRRRLASTVRLGVSNSDRICQRRAQSLQNMIVRRMFEQTPPLELANAFFPLIAGLRYCSDGCRNTGSLSGVFEHEVD
jgi:hypothetical protein